MNFIFDIGNVLVDYNPLLFLEAIFPDKAIVKRMHELIFLSREWADMDKGLLSQKEATEIFCKNEPNHTQEINLVMSRLNDLFTLKNATVNLLPKVREAGHKLFYLSNIQVEVRDYLLSEYDFLDMFDGGVYSCDVKAIKPSSEIYRSLLDKYELVPEDCLFFDDMEVNVEAARKEGIKSIVFTDASCVEPFL